MEFFDISGQTHRAKLFGKSIASGTNSVCKSQNSPSRLSMVEPVDNSCRQNSYTDKDKLTKTTSNLFNIQPNKLPDTFQWNDIYSPLSNESIFNTPNQDSNNIISEKCIKKTETMKRGVISPTSFKEHNKNSRSISNVYLHSITHTLNIDKESLEPGLSSNNNLSPNVQSPKVNSSLRVIVENSPVLTPDNDCDSLSSLDGIKEYNKEETDLKNMLDGFNFCSSNQIDKVAHGRKKIAKVRSERGLSMRSRMSRNPNTSLRKTYHLEIIKEELNSPIWQSHVLKRGLSLSAIFTENQAKFESSKDDVCSRKSVTSPDLVHLKRCSTGDRSKNEKSKISLFSGELVKNIEKSPEEEN